MVVVLRNAKGDGAFFTADYADYGITQVGTQMKPEIVCRVIIKILADDNCPGYSCSNLRNPEIRVIRGRKMYRFPGWHGSCTYSLAPPKSSISGGIAQ
ncbi:MAG: hypothetical protein K0R39_957 [Symbiobacteriaceae bacterium]|nr:hypothetical protein [Symbiobacteriaceae bacterium]